MRKDYIFNAIAGLVNASEAIILGMVIIRTNGLFDAGILSLAFSVGNLMRTIGYWGINSYQVSDVKHELSFSDYLVAHILSALVMLLASAIYIVCGLLRGHTATKSITIAAVCFIYLVESIGNTFEAFFQQRGKMYIGSIIFIVRWVLIMVAFSMVLVISQSLKWASLISAIIGLIVIIVGVWIGFPQFGEKIHISSVRGGFSVLKKTLPLCVSSFLSFYVVNTPKYSIDRYMTDDVQACYGFVAMPIFAIQLLNSFLYMPSLVPMSEEWHSGENVKFTNRIKKQCKYILGISVVCILGAFFVGIPILSLLYSTDLSEYKSSLMILMLSGVFLAYSGYFNTVITVMREQKKSMLGYFIIAVIAFFAMNPIVKHYGVIGACVLYAGLSVLLAGVFLWIVCRTAKFKG